MMPKVINYSHLLQTLAQHDYKNPQKTKSQIDNAVHTYKNLVAKLDTYVFNDGTKKELVCLDGTIPVYYKGAYYNIPVCVWIQDTHPYNSPVCYVKPTSDMQIKVSRYVDTSGRIYLPYLHAWSPSSSDLLGLIQVMIIVFGEVPPVFSKSSVPDSSYAPYPTQPSSYMPMPGVGMPYPPYPPVSGPAPYPPSNVPYPPYSGSGYPPAYDYPGYNSASGPTQNNSYPPASVSSGYMPTPSATVSSSAQQNSTGTISEEHIHASLLSAVEDKLKKRLREVLAQSQAELEVLKKTQDDLNKGKAKLEEMINRLKSEQVDLEKNVGVLKTKEEEMDDILNKVKNQESVDIDDAVVTTAPLYKQLLDTFAEENATEDAIYYLGEALRKGVVDLDLFLKHVRHLSRKQFMLRALMQKCRQKANLPH